MKKSKKILLLGLQCLTAAGLLAGVPAKYRNPVNWSDIPDMGLCSDGKDFYMVSTTMHLTPGAPIMRSSDMVNWQIVSYVFPRLPDSEDRYNLLDRRTAYGQGQWASSLRYHDGKFWCWFVMNGTGGFIYTADKAEGPWELYSQPGFMHDGSLFFDDDGSAYIAHGDGWITALTPDLKDRDTKKLDENTIDRSDETALLEGTSLFKHDGWYYRMMVSAFMPGLPRREVCYRSKSLKGPWEKKVILQTEFDGFGGVGQGCVVEKDGEWWALVFQDRGGVGRVPCLMPVVWTDGWPMLGNAKGDDIPNDTTVPYADVSGFIGSDEFDSETLSLYWQWNHNPIDTAWSLSERPGWMRLKTARKTDNLYLAPNTLTQRTCGPLCEGAVKLDVSGMKDGDVAGIAAFQGMSATLNVIAAGGKKVLMMREEQSQMDETDGRHAVKTVTQNAKETVDLKSDTIYLKVRCDFRNGCDFAEMEYSLDGKKWKAIGSRVPMRFDLTRMFMGTKFAIFNYATAETDGYVDVDWFRFETINHEERGAGNVSPERSEPRKRSLEGWERGTVLKAEQFPLGDVTLGEGMMKGKRDVDAKYLLDVVDADRLLAEFRNMAGLEKKAVRYPNRWEGGGINGHSLGHYLSAVSALYAVTRGTGNGERIPRAKRVAEGDALAGVGTDDGEIAARAKAKVDYIVSELAACQKANGNGYLMTCPQEIYEKVKSGDFTVGGFDINKWWVPNYTLHKVFAGLRDAYRWAGSKEALEVERRLGDWYIDIVSGLDDAQRQKLLVSEWGGLNETFANLADDTGDEKYRRAAEIYFDDRRIFDPLKMGVDDLDGKHANTQVPKIAGLARLYEQTGNKDYRRAVETFWDTVVNKRSFANGGHSDDEHFHRINEFPKKLGPHNNETCNINNMLRLTAHTFGWKPEASQMDFVERALYNQILAQIGKKEGEFGYFLSQAPVGEKVWSTPEGAWWCCVGTGMENPMHYTDHVYYRSSDDKTLYVNLFLPATLDWKSKGVKVVQKTAFPYSEDSTLTVRTKKPVRFAMKVRKPYWCRGIELKADGEKFGAKDAGKDGYIVLDREWKDGDEIALKLPMTLHASMLPQSEGTRTAFMYGPLVLVGLTPPQADKEDMAKRRWDDHLAAPGKTDEAAKCLVTTNIVQELRRFKKGKNLRFTVPSADDAFGSGAGQCDETFAFMPLMDVYEEHYSVYFPVLAPRKWAKEEKRLAAEHEREKAEAARIVDEVLPGFQQSEVNHDMRAEFSGVGDAYNRKWRNTIGVLGLIEYTLAVDGGNDNELVIQVNGSDGEQRYDILVDGEAIACEEHNEPLGRGRIVEQTYPIPRNLTDGKEKVRVSIKGFPEREVDGKKQAGSGWIGGFFYIAIKRPPVNAKTETNGNKQGYTIPKGFLPLRVQGKYLVDSKGDIARYRGSMQSLSPFFSGGKWGGGDDEDAAKRCVAYVKELLDMMGDRSQGSWYNMIRLTDDTYWCGKKDYRGNDRFERFDFARHKWYIEKVLVPVCEYAVSKGIYVIVRPSMNTEQDTQVGDRLQKHFVEEWKQFASNKRLQALFGYIAFELENEPVNVRNAENKDDPRAIADYMQPMIDAIRENGFKGVIWVPGAGYQSHFQGFMSKMVTDPLNNFGFAAHIYPGWYGQEDCRVSGEAFLARLLAQIPVVREYPVAVTECDWSPEKPGQGKLNEFGHYVPANCGSWGTATTSRWGKSLRWAVEKLGNVSMMIGGVDEVLDVDEYLRTAAVKPGFNGNMECCGPYAMKWFGEWAKAKKTKPSVFDKTRFREPSGKITRISNLKSLCMNLFQMTQGDSQLQMKAGDDSINVGFGPKEEFARSKEFCSLFKAVPVKVDGKIYFRLKCYYPDGVVRLSHLEWGNGDSVYMGRNLDGLYLGACLPKNEHGIRCGQDQNNDALWEVEKSGDGFSFRNAATGRYLGSAGSPCQENAAVWTCIARIEKTAK